MNYHHHLFIAVLTVFAAHSLLGTSRQPHPRLATIAEETSQEWDKEQAHRDLLALEQQIKIANNQDIKPMLAKIPKLMANFLEKTFSMKYSPDGTVKKFRSIEDCRRIGKMAATWASYRTPETTQEIIAQLQQAAKYADRGIVMIKDGQERAEDIRNIGQIYQHLGVCCNNKEFLKNASLSYQYLTMLLTAESEIADYIHAANTEMSAAYFEPAQAVQISHYEKALGYINQAIQKVAMASLEELQQQIQHAKKLQEYVALTLEDCGQPSQAEQRKTLHRLARRFALYIGTIECRLFGDQSQSSSSPSPTASTIRATPSPDADTMRASSPEASPSPLPDENE